MNATQLTSREHEVVRLVAEGKTDIEIGKLIGVGKRTARFHVDNARRKHNVSTRAQLIVKLMREGVLQ